MIKKCTRLIPVDKSGVWEVKAIHLYKGFCRKTSYTGDFIRVSIKKTKPAMWKEKGARYSSLVTRVSKENFKLDGSSFFFKNNSCVVLKKRLSPLGKELFGPASGAVRRKKFLSAFAGVL